jgi:carboxylesterase type B
MGSAHEFRWRFFADQFARRGVLVVIIQYRLGFLGMLASQTESMANFLCCYALF